jgi:uncharacterized repeat protein (TIGR01451 family)
MRRLPGSNRIPWSGIKPIRVKNIRLARTGIGVLTFGLMAATSLAAPSISSFSPALGRPGTQVVINGADFASTTKVEFDAMVADFIVTAANRIVATVPPDATTGKIRVSVSSSVFGESSTNFVVAPRVTEVDPPRSATNIFVTIRGFNFTNATQVLFSNNRTSVFSVTAATQIRARVPFGATNGPVTVVTTAGSATTTNDFVVTGPAPVIDSFSPAVGAPGAQVQIRGINFTNLLQVKFGNGNATVFSAPASSLVTAQVPNTATTGKITVQTSGGIAVSTNDFTVTLRPVITDFSPTFGVAGTPVLIEGINFAGFTGVGFNGKSVSGSGTPAPNQISVTVPVGATTGLISITNSFGVGYSSNDFVVTRAPIIESFDPQLGNAGATVIIRGANLSNGPTVLKIGGVNASFTVTGQNGIQIHSTVPNGATTGPIFMTNAFGSFTTSSNFSVPGSAPYITEFSPGRGPRGARVTIIGENFTSGAIVKFNGATDPTATATALTLIQATVPTNATTGPITVTTSAGTSTNANIFYVPPRLASFTPTNGVVGSSVVVTGANFFAIAEVLFNTAASTFTVTASNRLTAVVPTNATTGPLTISTPGGVVISTNNFRVMPNITGFSPAGGPEGTLVTINGTSFFNVTNVAFNNTSAAFTNVSSTEIRATVPFNATTGPIRVGTPDGTAVSASNFVATIPSDVALTMTSSAALLLPGQPLTYTLVVANTGVSAAVTGVAVTNTLPAGVNFVSASSTLGTCIHNAGVVSCAIGTLTNAAGVTITIDVVPPVEGVFVNTATLTAAEPDPDTSDNTASAVTTVVSNATRTLRIGRLPGDNVVISWPTSAVTFSLQFVNSLSSSNVWQQATNTPAVVGNLYTVTNSATHAQQFFRLRRP